MRDPGHLYEAHAEALLRYLTRLCGDHDVAADALQETFARLLAEPPRHEHRRAWLFRVATNLVREWSRTGRRRSELMEAAADVPALGEGPPRPDEAAERRALAARVRAALDRLPERDRTLLLMREEGFSHREMADAVGTTTKSVGTLIARALDRLARELPLQEEGARP